MFRVSYSECANEQRWKLCGRLADSWVEELRAYWNEVRKRAPTDRVVVDLKEVTFIDAAGAEVLSEIRSSGAELIASGIANKHLIATLSDHQGKAAPRRPDRMGATHQGENE